MLDTTLDERVRGLDVGDEFCNSFNLPKLGEDGREVSSPLSAGRMGPEMLNGVNGIAGLRKCSSCLEGVVGPVSLNGEPA